MIISDNEPYFRIIIANYNSSNWVEKCLKSIQDQTFPDWVVVIVDDLSTDDSVGKIERFVEDDDRFTLIRAPKKAWNGGARNIGLDYHQEAKYTLFMDDDDWMASISTLRDLHESTVAAGEPDCMRLPYQTFSDGQNHPPIKLDDDSPEKLVNSIFVAPWTKLVKTALTVPFPENTLIEDVVHHIAQCDKLATVGVHDRPVIVWNRDNTESTSLDQNRFKHNAKRVSSIYRNLADLMDLQCEHDYCEKHRKWRVQCYKDLVEKGVDTHA